MSVAPVNRAVLVLAQRPAGSSISVWSVVWPLGFDGPQLQHAEARAWVLGGHFERLVEVGALEDVESRELESLPGNRALADRRLASSHLNSSRVRERAEYVPLGAPATGVHFFAPSRHCSRDSRPLLSIELDARVAVRKE